MEVDRFAPIPMLLPQTTYHTYVYQLGHHHSEITTTICHRLPLPTTTFLHYLPPPTATYHYRYHSWRHLRDLRATFMNETHVRSTWPSLSKSAGAQSVVAVGVRWLKGNGFESGATPIKDKHVVSWSTCSGLAAGSRFPNLLDSILWYNNGVIQNGKERRRNRTRIYSYAIPPRVCKHRRV